MFDVVFTSPNVNIPLTHYIPAYLQHLNNIDNTVHQVSKFNIVLEWQRLYRLVSVVILALVGE